EERTKEIERLQGENAELRRHLSIHENPNVPPSVRNQAPGHTRAHPLTPPEKHKKPGAKPGHEGTTREPDEPDQRISLTALVCPQCHSRNLKLEGTEKKTEVELPPTPKPKATEYVQAIYGCEDCGAEVRATLPDGREPSEWGPLLRTEVVLGKVLDRLPYRKLRARLLRLGGKRLWMSTATLQGIVWRASERLAAEEEAIVRRLRASPWVHVDESIFRVAAKRWWLWVFVTETDVHFVIRPSRSRAVVHEVLGTDFQGKIVCDGWSAYLGWVLQRCWAHLLREGKEGAEKSPEARQLYGRLCALYHQLTRGLEKASLRERARRLRKGERALRGMLGRFGESEEEAVRHVVTYLRNGFSWWLTFLSHPKMDATNNRAERSLREVIVIRKIIGTLRKEEGANALTRLLSVLGTWALQGEDVPTRLASKLSRPS
ncbi:transposase IS66, partial [mine drainage metagenome]